MKQLFWASLLFTWILATSSYAQMGHEMMKEIDDEVQHSRMGGDKGIINKDNLQEGSKMQGEGGVALKEELMMGHQEMMNGMKDISYDMSNMMNDISRAIGAMSAAERERSQEKLKDISNLMKQICSEMNNMSEAIERGMMTDADMTMMKSRVMEMQESASSLKK
ncbi:MAG: hypothetical protein HY809_07145 [Nitrospirae bacterium]|nr:hypothetical protein [Nitrospirota bacterium]